jgi:DNA invertase Pin-like site-specific DNA recombinase
VSVAPHQIVALRRSALPDMIERTRAGLAAAAANGRKGGRPRKVDDADAAKARQLREKGIAAADIAKTLGVSRATVYRYLNEDSAAAVA